MQIQQRVQPIEERRYREYERDRMMVNEITDLSERIPLPMCNSFDYTMESDGHLYYIGDNIGQVLEDSVEAAQLAADMNPARYGRHLQHALIERTEYLAQRQLALGKTDDDVLVVISPKDSELGKHLTMVRVYTRNKTGIQATSISFETSDPDCLIAIANYFDQKITNDMSSEDILQLRLWGNSANFIGDVRDCLARLHDSVLEDHHGGEWSGGRRGHNLLDAQTFIRSHGDLLSELIAEISVVNGQEVPEEQKRTARERIRQESAAQLDRRLRGLGDARNRQVAINEAYSEGYSYENSCPDYGSSGDRSQSELGFGTWSYGECRACLRDGFVGACKVCSSCETDSNYGIDLLLVRQKALASRAVEAVARQLPSSRMIEKITKAQEGVLASAIAIGAIHYQLVHNRPKNTVATQVIDTATKRTLVTIAAASN